MTFERSRDYSSVWEKPNGANGDRHVFLERVAAGLMTQMTRVRGYAENRTNNSLLQLTTINSSITGTSLPYNYSTTENNGRITTAVNNGETLGYSYDSLNRLSAASGSGWGLNY